MRVTTNEKLIKRGRRIATIMTAVGMALLFGSIFVAQNEARINIAFLMSITGFIVTVTATRYTKKWIRTPRANVVLDKVLKGMGHKYHIFHYVLPKVDHVLVGPQGVFVLNAQPADGAVRYENGRWRRKFHWTQLLRGFGDDAVGDATGDVHKETEALQEFIDAQLPDSEIQVEGVIVFTNERLQLDAESAPVAVARVDKLKALLRTYKKKALDSNTQQELEEKLDAQIE